MQNEYDTLSDVIKEAREKCGLSISELADRISVTERHLYRIENENKKPSYEVLFKLIRELSISPDLIFYPDEANETSELNSLLHTLHKCDPRSIEVIRATVTALIKTAKKEE